MEHLLTNGVNALHGHSLQTGAAVEHLSIDGAKVLQFHLRQAGAAIEHCGAQAANASGLAVQLQLSQACAIGEWRPVEGVHIGHIQSLAGQRRALAERLRANKLNVIQRQAGQHLVLGKSIRLERSNICQAYTSQTGEPHKCMVADGFSADDGDCL